MIFQLAGWDETKWVYGYMIRWMYGTKRNRVEIGWGGVAVLVMPVYPAEGICK